jgi:hypothetical protein
MRGVRHEAEFRVACGHGKVDELHHHHNVSASDPWVLAELACLFCPISALSCENGIRSRLKTYGTFGAGAPNEPPEVLFYLGSSGSEEALFHAADLVLCRNVSMAKPGPHGKDKQRCRFHGGRSTGPLTEDGKARSLAATRAGRQRWLAEMRTKKAAARSTVSPVAGSPVRDGSRRRCGKSGK